MKYTEQAVETLDDAGSVIANKNIEIEQLSKRVAELEAVLRVCRGVIEEAQTYCEGPQWSPSMAHDCGTAIAKIDEVLSK